MSNQINTFKNEYRFLSNFYESDIIYKNEVYPTAEHLFQALKSKSSIVRGEIRILPTPSKAKKCGRSIPLRKDWEEIKDKIMYMVARLKFLQNSELGLHLKNTNDKQLVEGNYWHDNYWGSCTCFKCRNIKGKNQLGKILMKVRRMI